MKSPIKSERVPTTKERVPATRERVRITDLIDLISAKMVAITSIHIPEDHISARMASKSCETGTGTCPTGQTG